MLYRVAEFPVLIICKLCDTSKAWLFHTYNMYYAFGEKKLTNFLMNTNVRNNYSLKTELPYWFSANNIIIVIVQA